MSWRTVVDGEYRWWWGSEANLVQERVDWLQGLSHWNLLLKWFCPVIFCCFRDGHKGCWSFSLIGAHVADKVCLGKKNISFIVSVYGCNGTATLSDRNVKGKEIEPCKMGFFHNWDLIVFHVPSFQMLMKGFFNRLNIIRQVRGHLVVHDFVPMKPKSIQSNCGK